MGLSPLRGLSFFPTGFLGLTPQAMGLLLLRSLTVWNRRLSEQTSCRLETKN
jgi:hypothetical protein